MGAWIEMCIQSQTWGSGTVAPLVGAWIEIAFICINKWQFTVAPLVGAWIEIPVKPLGQLL